MAETMSENTNYVVNIDNAIEKCIINKEYTEIRQIISELIQAANPGLAFGIINKVVQICISQGKNTDEIGELISELIKNRDSKNVSNIVSVVIQAYILKKKDMSEIRELISKLIEEKDPKDVFAIVNATVQVCIVKGKATSEIGELISELIKNRDSKNVSNIVAVVIQAYILQKKDMSEIRELISKLIEEKDPKDVSAIVEATVQVCIVKGKAPSEISKLIEGKYSEDVSDIVNASIQTCIAKIKNINEIGELISKLIKNKDLEDVSAIVEVTVQTCILQEKDIDEIEVLISKLIEGKDSEDVFTIINATVQTCILQEKDMDKIEVLISKLIKNKDSKNVSVIVDATVQACILQEKDMDEIKELISELIKNKDSKDVSHIVDATIEACIFLKKKNHSKIRELISEFIKNKDPKDVSYIVDATVRAYIAKEEKIEEVIDIFNYCKDVLVGCELKEKIKLIFSLILSKYLMDTIINDSKRDKETEGVLLKEYKNFINNEINNFDEIILKDLLSLCNSYFRERFNIIGINSGCIFETFLKGICELINKEGTTIRTLYGKVDLFKNFKFLNLQSLQSEKDISSKAELFNALGLGEKDFEKKDTNNAEQNFTVVYCTYLNHSFIMIIDRTKTWREAIRPDTDSIKLIDSTKYVLETKAKQFMSEPIRDNIFNEHCEYLNTLRYQKNGTCWINAASAFFTLLQKKKEKQKQAEKKYFTMEDIICGFESNKEDTLSPLEEDIVAYSTEKYFSLTKCFKKKDLTKEIIQDNLITECHYLKQIVDKYKAGTEKLEYISEQLNLKKLESVMTVLEQPEMDIQSVVLAPPVFD